MTYQLKPQDGRQEIFLSSDADIAIYGGSAGGGKTFSLLMEAGRFVHVPNYHAVIFRRTYPQITVSGGLWDESMKIYPHLPCQPSPKVGLHEWTFSTGSKVSFRHMDNAEMNYQGSQFAVICFDQLEELKESDFFFMLSRNRSTCGIKPYIRATANPKPNWLGEFLAWWIGSDGYARLDRIGIKRYFIRVGGKIIWANTEAELIEKYGDESMPLSVTFIPSSVYDNKILLKNNPSYVAMLKALPPVERQRLLGDKERGGNWKVQRTGNMFKREWIKIIDKAPKPYIQCRFWDMASTEAKDGKDPDFTAGALLGWLNGDIYILDLRHDRLSPQGNEALVRQTAMTDGEDTFIRMEEEGGSSGKVMIDHYKRTVLQGFNFAGIRSTGSKELRATPLSGQCEAGNVFMLKADWNKTLLDEMESFPEGIHDDAVDATALSANFLMSRIRQKPLTKQSIDSDDLKHDKMIATMLEQMSPEERKQAEELIKRYE